MEASKLNKEKKTIAIKKKVVVKGKKPNLLNLSDMDERMKAMKQDLKDFQKRDRGAKTSVNKLYKERKVLGLFHTTIKFDYTITYFRGETRWTTPKSTMVLHRTIKTANRSNVKVAAGEDLEETLEGWSNEYSYYSLVKIITRRMRN